MQPTAVAPGATTSILAGVSCASATSCVAVGGDETGQNAQDRLAYSWNGTRWTLVEASSPPGGVYGFLAGVSCTTATACIAVGNELNASTDDIVALAQAWDGSTWKVLTVPGPAGAIVSRLYGVSCGAAATCTAVGASIQAATRPGAPPGPRGVRPGAAARRAAWGADGRGAWPGPGGGTAASTGGPLAATLAEAWNGTTWSIQATPNPAGTTGIDELAGVSCMSATSCTAMGSASAVGDSSAGTLGETWNGTAWTLVTVPGPGPSFNALAGVSCTPAACLAVGYYRDGTDTHLALAVASAGGGWAVQPAPSPPGAVPSILAGVSCGAASACAAVGFYHNSPGTTRTLAEAWNGSAWRVEQAPDSPALPQNTLASVSCTSATACMAVGRVYSKRSGTTLAESWNGTAWALRPGPALPGTFGQLSGVSCTSAVACTAVGSYDNGTLPLAESWNGTAWTLQQVPAPAGGFDPQLESVSCTSPSACTAVGNYESPGTLNLLAERWNGTAWTVQATPGRRRHPVRRLLRVGDDLHRGRECLQPERGFVDAGPAVAGRHLEEAADALHRRRSPQPLRRVLPVAAGLRRGGRLRDGHQRRGDAGGGVERHRLDRAGSPPAAHRHRQRPGRRVVRPGRRVHRRGQPSQRRPGFHRARRDRARLTWQAQFGARQPFGLLCPGLGRCRVRVGARYGAR